GWQDYVASIRAYWQAHVELAAAAGHVLDVPQTSPLSIPGARAQPMAPHSGRDMPTHHENNDDPNARHDMPEHHDHGAEQ
ncbi:MAG: hypothetical protein AAF229_11340, partial [Pseudomonadota bacterium]